MQRQLKVVYEIIKPECIYEVLNPIMLTRWVNFWSASLLTRKMKSRMSSYGLDDSFQKMKGNGPTLLQPWASWQWHFVDYFSETHLAVTP